MSKLTDIIAFIRFSTLSRGPSKRPRITSLEENKKRKTNNTVANDHFASGIQLQLISKLRVSELQLKVMTNWKYNLIFRRHIV